MLKFLIFILFANFYILADEKAKKSDISKKKREIINKDFVLNYKEEEKEEGEVVEVFVDEKLKVVDEVLLEVNGIRSYHHFRNLKTNIRKHLPKGTSFMERKISYGKVLFAIKTQEPIEKVKKYFDMLMLEKGRFTIKHLSKNVIVSEIR